MERNLPPIDGQTQSQKTSATQAFLIYGDALEVKNCVIFDANAVGLVEERLPLCRLPGMKNGAWGLCLQSGLTVPVYTQASLFGRELDPDSDRKLQEIYENPAAHRYTVLMDKSRSMAVILFSRLRPLLKNEKALLAELPVLNFTKNFRPRGVEKLRNVGT